MHLYEVGKPYMPGRQSYPEEADYNCREGEYSLVIFLHRPTRKELEAIKSGPVEFGFFAEPQGLFLITRFGRALTFDCSFHAQRLTAVTGEQAQPHPMEEVSPKLRAAMHILLIDADSGIILALRRCTFSPEFTRSLHRAIADQVVAEYNRVEHDRWANSIIAWFNTHELWQRCTVWCVGGV
jgi:hypothetical protein